MAFSNVYPLLIQKAERKGCAKFEVDAAICWLTGYDEHGLQAQIDKGVGFETFFAQAPQINPNGSRLRHSRDLLPAGKRIRPNSIAHGWRMKNAGFSVYRKYSFFLAVCLNSSHQGCAAPTQGNSRYCVRSYG
jgi:hypothetical protein